MFIIAVSKRNLQKYTQISLISVLEHRSSAKSPVACAVVIMLPFAYPLAERTWHDQHFAQALTLHCSHTFGRAQKSAQSRIWSIEWQLGGILEELNIVCPVCTSYLLLRQEFPYGLRSIAKKVHEAPAIRVVRAKLNGLCKACIYRKKLRVSIYRVAAIYTVSRVMKANVTDPQS